MPFLSSVTTVTFQEIFFPSLTFSVHLQRLENVGLKKGKVELYWGNGTALLLH